MSTSVFNTNIRKVEKKIFGGSGLVKKSDYEAKISREIRGKVRRGKRG